MNVKVLLIAAVSSVLLPGETINFDSPPVTDSGWGGCAESAGTYSCDTTAFFDAYSLNTANSGAISPLFQQAFNNWNATVNDGWTLVSGGALGGYFDVSQEEAQESTGWTTGGAQIEVDIQNITGLPTLTPGESLVWVQALYVNYDVNSDSIIAPVYQFDLASGTCNVNGPNNWCPPAYPYQYGSGQNSTGIFYDEPAAPYNSLGTTQAVFDANTYLAVENTSTDVLTVYDGVCYGFQNNVSSTQETLPPLQPEAGVCSAAQSASPEPDDLVLCASGLMGIYLFRRKIAWFQSRP